MRVPALPAIRPPCSLAEQSAAQAFADALAAQGLRPAIDSMRAISSPTWPPLLRALLRVWSAAFLAAGLRWPAVVTAGLALVGLLPTVSALVRHLPLVGGISQNVSALVRGTDPDLRPVIVVAHLDTHPTDGAPLSRPHRLVAATTAWLAFIGALFADPLSSSLRVAVGIVAAEAVLTLAWLARRELQRPTDPPDDDTSGLMALAHLAELSKDAILLRDMWMVATGAATSGGDGMTAFLKSHPELGRAWVLEIDALGSGEVVAAPHPPRLPHPGTPPALARVVEIAARKTGDPMNIRRVRRPHSDARAAQRSRVAGITLTAGIPHPAGPGTPDPANAARAARVALEVARIR